MVGKRWSPREALQANLTVFRNGCVFGLLMTTECGRIGNKKLSKWRKIGPFKGNFKMIIS